MEVCDVVKIIKDKVSDLSKLSLYEDKIILDIAIVFDYFKIEVVHSKRNNCINFYIKTNEFDTMIYSHCFNDTRLLSETKFIEFFESMLFSTSLMNSPLKRLDEKYTNMIR